MPLKIIVINGVATHGKDSFVNFVQKHFDGDVASHSTVATVKKAGLLFGADEKKCKGDAERRLWSDMKDAWTRYCDGPFNEVINRVTLIDEANESTPEFKILFFVHAREPKEIQKIKTRFGARCMTLLVRGAPGHIPDNHADREVEIFPYDIVIDNTGTLAELETQAKTFIQSLASAW